MRFKLIPGHEHVKGLVYVLYNHGNLDEFIIKLENEPAVAYSIRYWYHERSTNTHYYLGHNPHYQHQWKWIEMRFFDERAPQHGGELISYWPGKLEDTHSGLNDYILT